MNEVIKEMLNQKIEKIIISNPKSNQSTIKKIIIRPVMIKKMMVYQCEQYTTTQVFHLNIQEDALEDKLMEEMAQFKQTDAYTDQAEYHIKVSKKDKVFVSKKENVIKKEINLSHNRNKTYLLQEGDAILAFQDLGIFTKEGKIVRSMYDKYKQINRYIEMIDDLIKEEKLDFLRIVDFGCGKSYLTFIVYHYLVNIKKIKVDMIGLDLKKDVIEHCSALAKKYGYHDLRFEVGDINGYQSKDPIDMVISLHACDTATDYALYNAIIWNAKYIFSAPCCQHELNQNSKSKDLKILNRYGLIQERISALLTDAIRSNLLITQGYDAQILEFIDIAHSPKNILIRAKRKQHKKKEEALKEVEVLLDQIQCNQTLYQLLKQANML